MMPKQTKKGRSSDNKKTDNPIVPNDSSVVHLLF